MAKAGKHSEQDNRAAAFQAKLVAWLSANEQLYKRGRDNGQPRNAEQLAKRISGHPLFPEHCLSGTVRAWEHGRSLPGTRFAAALESLMGVPWTYLSTPGAEFPIRDTEYESVMRALVSARSAENARRVAVDLRRASSAREPA